MPCPTCSFIPFDVCSSTVDVNGHCLLLTLPCSSNRCLISRILLCAVIHSHSMPCRVYRHSPHSQHHGYTHCMMARHRMTVRLKVVVTGTVSVTVTPTAAELLLAIVAGVVIVVCMWMERTRTRTRTIPRTNRCGRITICGFS